MIPLPPPGLPLAAATRISGLRRISALTLFYFAAIGLFNPYAPLWFKSLGFSTLVIGGIASLQSWSRVVAPYAWSWVGDHHGRRTELIRLSAAGALLAALGLLGVRGALPVAVVTTFMFLANSGVVPLYEALLAKLLNTSKGIDPRLYGRVRVWGSIGFILAVTAFGTLLDTFGIKIFPYFVAVMNLLLLAAALRLPVYREDVKIDEPVPPVLPLLRQPRVAWFFASVFFTVLAHTSLYAFFSLYLVSLGYDKSAVGGLWAVSVAVEIVFFFNQGRWSGWASPHRWLQIVAAVCAVRFSVTAAFGIWPVMLVLAQLTHCITFVAHHAACISLVHKLFPNRLRGRGQALYTTLGYGVPGVLGGVGGGWLISNLGFASVYWAAAVSSVLAWACATYSRKLDAAQA